MKKEWSAPQITDLDSTLNNTGNLNYGPIEGGHRTSNHYGASSYAGGSGIYSVPS